MMNRRTFLKAMTAAASGLILPDWIVRAENYIEQEGKPYLELPRRAESILYAVDWGDEYRFALGDPHEEAPSMDWREFLDLSGFDSLEEYFGTDDPEEIPVDLDDKADYWTVSEWWLQRHSPDVKAFHYLESLDLGPDFGVRDSVGEICFVDGVCPGNDAMFVTAPDQLSLSLLQRRLNDLEEGVKIVLTSL